jgi:hypothetical protein
MKHPVWLVKTCLVVSMTVAKRWPVGRPVGLCGGKKSSCLLVGRGAMTAAEVMAGGEMVDGLGFVD